MSYKTGNPALNPNTFNNILPATNGSVMTLQGTARKSLFLIALCIIGGVFGWYAVKQDLSTAGGFILVGSLVGLIVAIITIFAKKTSPVTAPLYALIEGGILGAVSQLYEQQFSGIVLQSLLATFGVFSTMLVAYMFHIIQPTARFRMGVTAATGGIALYYLGGLIASLLGAHFPLISSNSIFGIGFSFIVVIVAAFNLVLDFDFINQGVVKGSPRYMEWYSAFGLIVTLVWLYLEILRLLGKIRSR